MTLTLTLTMPLTMTLTLTLTMPLTLTVTMTMTMPLTMTVTVTLTVTVTVAVTLTSTSACVSYLPLEDTKRFYGARLNIPVVREFLVVGPCVSFECAGVIHNSTIAQLNAAVVYSHQAAAVNITAAKQRDPRTQQSFETLSVYFFNNAFHVFLL